METDEVRIRPGWTPTDSRLAGDRRLPPPPGGGGKSTVEGVGPYGGDGGNGLPHQ